MTGATATVLTDCSAARTGEGYWTCDQPGGCDDCRRLAVEIDDHEQLSVWNGGGVEEWVGFRQGAVVATYSDRAAADRALASRQVEAVAPEVKR